MRSLHALLAILLLAVACIPAESLPATCDDPSVALSAAVLSGQTAPTQLDVCRGQHITLTITSDRDGLLHLHGYDAEAPAVQVQAGGSGTFQFDAIRSGQFPVELHPLDSSTAVNVAVLFVHEH